ncbi:MAG: hypothetical protein LBC65_00215 [Oscillospiraceae bacterium]|nr:hypothetical protein [Oscillospiraceae bacterium]
MTRVGLICVAAAPVIGRFIELPLAEGILAGAALASLRLGCCRSERQSRFETSKDPSSADSGGNDESQESQGLPRFRVQNAALGAPQAVTRW